MADESILTEKQKAFLRGKLWGQLMVLKERIGSCNCMLNEPYLEDFQNEINKIAKIIEQTEDMG